MDDDPLTKIVFSNNPRGNLINNSSTQTTKKKGGLIVEPPRPNKPLIK